MSLHCMASVKAGRATRVHPTWVVGALRPHDFTRLLALPHATLLTVEAVTLAYLPPVEGDEIALCVVDLETLPEKAPDGATLKWNHTITGMQSVWLGAGGNRLDTHRALDRLECLTGLSPQELRSLEVLVEDEPELAVQRALTGRLGPLTTGVSLQALRACRPGNAPLSARGEEGDPEIQPTAIGTSELEKLTVGRTCP